MPRKSPAKPPGNPPFPGAAPTVSAIPARGLVVGRFAVCTIGGSIVVNIYDWEVNINFDFADATAHGDFWKQKVFLDGDWTARGRGYLAATSVTVISALTSSQQPTQVTFRGFSDTTQTTKIWEGTAFITRGRLAVPMTLLEQEWELVSTGTPTAGLS